MNSRTRFTLPLIVLAALAWVLWPKDLQSEPNAAPISAESTTGSDATSARAETSSASAIGFTSQHALDEHFDKHGREFGSITIDEYLRLACTLRDAPAGGNVLEAARADGVISRFDTHSGAFIAFNADRTIRTFFKPNDGRRYFERQIEKAH